MQHKFDAHGNLVLEIEDTDREEIDERSDMRSDEDLFIDLLEPMLCNGWDKVDCACWGGLAITNDLVQNEDGETVHCGPVYTFIEYAVISEIQVLLRDGKITLNRYESDEEDKQFGFTTYSDVYGGESFGPYAIYDEAQEGITRVMDAARQLNDGIKRDYSDVFLWLKD